MSLDQKKSKRIRLVGNNVFELSVLLDKQLELVMRIAQNQSDLSMKNGNSQIISNAESLLKLGVTLEQK